MIVCSILPVFVILGSVYSYLELQLEVGADKFFNRAQERGFRWEQKYVEEMLELKASLIESSKEFLPKSETVLHPKRYQPLKQLLENSKDYSYSLKAYSDGLTPDFQNKFLLGLKRIRKEALSKFAFLKSEDIYLQFFGYDIVLQYAEDHLDIPSSLAMTSLLRVDPQQNPMLEFLFSNFAQFIVRNKFNQISAKVALEALKYNFDFDHEKLKVRFEQIFFRPLAMEVFVKLIPLKQSSRKAIGLNDGQLALKTDLDSLPRGCLAMSINVQNLFPQAMIRFASENPLFLEEVQSEYNIFAFASSGGIKKNPFQGFKDILLMDTDFPQSLNSSSELWDQLLKDRKTTRFSYVDRNGKRHFGFAFPDSILRGFIHFFSVSHEELVNSQRKFTLLLLFGMISVLCLFLILATFLARGFSKPLQQFTKRVTTMARKLDPELIEDFSHRFIEFGIMRSAFLTKVRNLARRFHLARELSSLQSCIQNHPCEDDFRAQLMKVYDQCFGLRFSHYDFANHSLHFHDHIVVLEQSGDGEQTFGSWSLRASGEETAPFHEQVRFFYVSRLLEEQYKSALKTEQEFLISRQIQQDLLPAELPRKNFLQSTAYFEPAKTLGGDFYDYHQALGKDLFVIADVSGKGLGAALYAAFTKAILHVISHTEVQVNAVLSNLHEILVEYGDQGFFCTLFLAKLDSRKRHLQYASAGHNRMMLVRDHGVQFLSGRGLPVGILTGPGYSLEEFDLQSGDIIFLYTDGLTELEGKEGELLGEERLVKMLHENRSDSLDELRAKIVESLHEFSEHGQLSDDVTFLIIKVNRGYESGD